MKQWFLSAIIFLFSVSFLSAHPDGHSDGLIQNFVHFLTDPFHLAMIFFCLAAALGATSFMKARRKSAIKERVQD